MDNLTHSLIGFTLAKTLTESSPPSHTPQPQLTRAAQWIAVLGSNLPDIDFGLSPLFEDKSLGYLVHHRGYTHTLWFAMIAGLLLSQTVIKIFRITEKKGMLYALGVLALLLHISFDFLNNYGTHPLSPLTNQWFYGDTLFIVEPTLWFWLLPWTFFEARERSIRFGSLLLLFAMGGLVLSLKFTHLSTTLFLLVFGGLSFALNRNPKQTPVRAAGLLLVVALFGAGSYFAKNKIKSALAAWSSSEWEALQTSTTPLPSNPFCWGFLRSETSAKTYRVTAGTVALAPALFSIEACSEKAFTRGPNLLFGSPQKSFSQQEDPKIKITGLYQRPLEELKSLNNSCRFNQFMKFARFPYWIATQTSPAAGDLRFASPAGGFAHLELKSSLPCQELYAPWERPSGLF